MSVERAQLLTRKEDLFEALRALERDHEAGTIDDAAFHAARDRYESEAASVLERLDAGGPISVGTLQGTATQRRSRGLAITLAVGGVVLALVVLMVGALRARGAGESTTGSLPPTVSLPTSVSPAVRAAERAVSHHLHSASDWTLLAQAQLNAGNATDGTVALKEAIRLDPHRADAPTLYAIVLASGGHFVSALDYLARAERAQPAYARAWFADGMIASKHPTTLPRAVTAWKQFLRLQPHASVSDEVRLLLRAAERVAGR